MAFFGFIVFLGFKGKICFQKKVFLLFILLIVLLEKKKKLLFCEKIFLFYYQITLEFGILSTKKNSFFFLEKLIF